MPGQQDYSTNGTTSATSTGWERTGQAYSINELINFTVTENKKGINPTLYFNYIKKRFGMLEKMKLDGFLSRIEKAFYKAVENGQEALADKMLDELGRVTREAVMYTKGIRFFIDVEEVRKYKNKIRGGHISDTKFEYYTRVIPDKILKKKKSLEGVFDDFIIYHAYINEIEEKREKKQKIGEKEKARMKDPVLFGYIKENPRVLYVIDSWDDELCDLSFEEMVDALGKEEKEITLQRNPVLNLTK